MAWFALAVLLLAPAPRPARADDDAPAAEEPADQAPADQPDKPDKEPADQEPQDKGGEVLDIQAAAKAVNGPVVLNVDHETWRMIGWDDACSVAFVHLSFPVLGEAQINEPIRTRVGELSIAPGKDKYQTHVVLEADGDLSWDAKKLAKAEADLKKGGWTRPGFPEVIRSSAVAAQPGLAETIFSTAALNARIKKWPGPEWRWAEANYNPLSTCALLIFEKKDAPRFYSFVLTRIYNQRARHDRARAHSENSRLLFQDGDMDGALAEAEIGARAAPDRSISRYSYAAMLSLTGHPNQAIEELRAAVALDPKYAARARDDDDFADLRSDDRFQAVVNPPR